jgi:hypothetical protein
MEERNRPWNSICRFGRREVFLEALSLRSDTAPMRCMQLAAEAEKSIHPFSRMLAVKRYFLDTAYFVYTMSCVLGALPSTMLAVQATMDWPTCQVKGREQYL